MILDDETKVEEPKKDAESKDIEIRIFISMGFILIGMVGLVLMFLGLDIIDLIMLLGVSFFAAYPVVKTKKNEK